MFDNFQVSTGEQHINNKIHLPVIPAFRPLIPVKAFLGVSAIFPDDKTMKTDQIHSYG